MRCNIIGETLSLTWHNGAAEYSPNLSKSVTSHVRRRLRASHCVPDNHNG
jgi:hypothetical protein